MLALHSSISGGQWICTVKVEIFLKWLLTITPEPITVERVASVAAASVAARGVLAVVVTSISPQHTFVNI